MRIASMSLSLSHREDVPAFQYTFFSGILRVDNYYAGLLNLICARFT